MDSRLHRDGLEVLARGLALASIVPCGATFYFFVFWRWFEFWRRHRTWTYVMMVGTLVIVGIAAVMLRREVLAERFCLPIVVQGLGWTVAGIATVLVIVADRQIGVRVRSFAPFFEERREIELITAGAYGVVRHPIYAAGVWFQLGAFLATGYAVILVACAILLLGALWFTRQEERRLVERLRDPAAYDRYRERVSALFPWRPRIARVPRPSRDEGPTLDNMTAFSEPRQVAPGVLRIEKVATSGWCWNMVLVMLPGGRLLVYNPTSLGTGDDVFARLDALGEVTVLVAPNNVHHLSLARFRARYPKALAVASATALPRLAGRGHAGLAELEAATLLLPDGARWLRCEGTKSGEAWLSLPSPEGPTWIVCDAFFNVTRPVTGVTGAVLRALHVTPGLRISRTYIWLALRDARAYRDWTLAVLAQERPRSLVVCHGEPAASADLEGELAALVRAHIRL
jgi:protein-S-isoprenylcysteine O-methyltransferase Ste14